MSYGVKNLVCGSGSVSLEIVPDKVAAGHRAHMEQRWDQNS